MQQNGHSFEILLQEAKALGLFQRTKIQYALHATLLVLAYGVCLYVLTVSDSLAVQIPNALFFGFITVQWGMLGHDLSHKQVFASDKLNAFFGTVAWGLFSGLSQQKWYERHNSHHKHPNQIGKDPDLDIPFHFSKAQRAFPLGFLERIFLPKQHIIFFMVLPVVYLSYIRASFAHIFHTFGLVRFFELLLIAVHFAAVFYFIFFSLPVLVAVMFTLMYVLTTGLYMGLVFAPNHKGLDILPPESAFVWTNQILLTRNLPPSAMTTFLFGGLNFQIEHHLFPSVSRFKQRNARSFVKTYCATEGLSHIERTWVESMGDIYVALREESSVALSTQEQTVANTGSVRSS